jgi:putative cardiolipin synthase
MTPMTISIAAAASFFASKPGRFMAVLVSILISACGSLPTQVDRPVSAAKQAPADSPLVRITQDSTPAPTLTGFRLMPDGFYSLDTRIQLARRARDSLDVQYYLIQDDRTGRLLMRTLRDAALRGVRVRLLVDDLYTAGSDPMFRGLAAFPNVEVRLFNPFCCGRESIPQKYLASLFDFRRLNHRMHNKLFIADGVAAVMGGRNIADEYFTRSAQNNFIDMDVFIVGPVVQQLGSIFDAYWNSSLAYPVEAIVGEIADREAMRRDFDHRVDDGEQMMSVALPPLDLLGYRPISDDLDGGRLRLHWGTALAFSDQPAKVLAKSPEAARAMSAQMNIMDRVMTSESEVVISSPYFIPGPVGLQEFSDLRRRNVAVTVLTNSFAANDEPLAHKGYARYREDLLRTGVDIYELSPRRTQRDERFMLPSTSLGRLHAKTAVIDQSSVYIGSVNLDPRSDSTNTELGLFARCPELAKEVTRVIDVSKLQGSYRLQFAPDGRSLEWLATDDQGEVVHSVEPEVTPFMRLRNMLLGPFVPEQLL